MRQRSSGGGGYAAPGNASQNYYGGYRGGNDGYSNSGSYGGYSQQSYGGYNAGSSGMYTGYAAAPSEDNKYKKSSKSAPSIGSLMGGFSPLLLLCLLMGLWSFAAMGLWMNARGKYNSILGAFNAPDSDQLMNLYKNLQQDLARAQREKDRTVRETERKLKSRQAELERENRLLQKERDELRVKHEGPDKEEEESRMLLRDEAFRNQLELLQEATRKESRRNVVERFGPGPHEVEFRFEMEGAEKAFVVELAPLDAVPHAVHVFLEQVEHGLWNGCYFYLNGPHVIQAGPQLSDEDEAHAPEDDAEDRAEAMRPFKSLGLDQLAFPDYSDAFPHKPWTLGFTGRPGGPDFYINKVDNSEAHGPGGQYQHALQEQGDSCFGIITRGKEHAAALFAQPVYGDRSEWHYFLTEPVEILEAKVLTQRPEGTPQARAPIEHAHHHNGEQHHKPRIPKIEHAVEP